MIPENVKAAVDRLRKHYSSLADDYNREDHDDPDLRQHIDDGLLVTWFLMQPTKE